MSKHQRMKRTNGKTVLFEKTKTSKRANTIPVPNIIAHSFGVLLNNPLKYSDIDIFPHIYKLYIFKIKQNQFISFSFDPPTAY